MTFGDCLTPSLPQSDVSISSAPYTITANERNPLGYSKKFCISCEIEPIGLPMILFTIDEFTVSALPLDCNESLTFNN